MQRAGIHAGEATAQSWAPSGRRPGARAGLGFPCDRHQRHETAEHRGAAEPGRISCERHEDTQALSLSLRGRGGRRPALGGRGGGQQLHRERGETEPRGRHSLSSSRTWHFSAAALRPSCSRTSLSTRFHLCRSTRTSRADSTVAVTVRRFTSLEACSAVARYLRTESSAPKKPVSWEEAKVGLWAGG